MSWATMDDQERTEVAEWLVATCRLFGASLATSHKVTGLFVAGLDAESARPERSNDS